MSGVPCQFQNLRGESNGRARHSRDSRLACCKLQKINAETGFIAITFVVIVISLTGRRSPIPSPATVQNRPHGRYAATKVKGYQPNSVKFKVLVSRMSDVGQGGRVGIVMSLRIKRTANNSRTIDEDVTLIERINFAVP